MQSPFIFVTGLMCMVLCIKNLVELARFPMTLDGRIHVNQGTIAISSTIIVWCALPTGTPFVFCALHYSTAFAHGFSLSPSAPVIGISLKLLHLDAEN